MSALLVRVTLKSSIGSACCFYFKNVNSLFEVLKIIAPHIALKKKLLTYLIFLKFKAVLLLLLSHFSRVRLCVTP